MSDIVADMNRLLREYADEITTLRAELAAAKERAEKAEGERDEADAEITSTEIMLGDERRMRFAAEAMAEGLAKALEAEREAIAEYVDRNLMSCRDYAAAIRSRAQESETGAVSTTG